MDMNLPVIAGSVSTIFFLLGEMPMLSKAFRTKELASYSIGNITTANAGNMVHSVYVYSLPPGPIWLLHSFYMVTTAIMLFWYLRYEGWPRIPSRVGRPHMHASHAPIRKRHEIPHPNTLSGE